MSLNTFPRRVTIFEVGPRDGLQNEATTIEAYVKVSLVNRLSNTGLSKIEAGSFVSPKWVPQMKSSSAVFSLIDRNDGISYTALTPNLKGLDAAIESGVDEVAIFGAASESFSQKNINCSINESLERFRPLVDKALSLEIPVRGYVSCVVGCPYEGFIEPQQVAHLAKELFEMGCYEISLGDTIGVGTPSKIQAMIVDVSDVMPIEKIALHCHDTYGQALANIYAALDLGVSVFDSSVAGLGGCPYAKGASGNVATEDLLYMLDGMGIETGVDLEAMISVGDYISKQLGRENQSKVAKAYLANS
jgi:hydroxymethylglutaryl-CoA lyase